MEVKEEVDMHGLVDISQINKNIILDLRYASTNNITGRKLYSEAKCFLKKDVAEELSRIQKELEKENLCLIIWDGYRPTSVQKILLEEADDPSYLAKVSKHSRGVAVDLTIGDSQGNPLKMPTDFDHLNEEAHHDFIDLPEEVIANREKLKNVMEKHGFSSIRREWWHYNFIELKGSEALDMIF